MTDGGRRWRGDQDADELDLDADVEARALALIAAGTPWLAALAQAVREREARDSVDEGTPERASRRREANAGVPGRASRTAALPPSPSAPASPSAPPGPPIHRRADEHGAPPTYAPDLRALGAGAPLPSSLRAQLAAALGFDLDEVRVHLDAAADEAARSLGALAFAVGRDIGFRAGAYDPSTPAGVHLIAHEVAHTVQPPAAPTGAQRISQPGDPGERAADAFADAFTRAYPAPDAGAGATSRAPATAALAPAPAVAGAATVHRAPDPAAAAVAVAPDPARIDAAVERIVRHLKGFTSASASAAIVAEFAAYKTVPGALQAILDGLKARAAQHRETPAGMIRWLLGDLTVEGRRDLVAILSRSGVTTDIAPLVADDVVNDLRGWTSDADSKEIARKLAALSGASLDGVLGRLVERSGTDERALTTWLFSDLQRTDAERLRLHFLAAGGPVAVRFALAHTADKLESLVAGYTSHADSSSIVGQFESTPVAHRAALQQALAERVRERWSQSLAEVLQQELDPADYDRLRALPGLELPAFDERNRRGRAGEAIAAAEWVVVGVEVVAGAAIGIVTGLLAFLVEIPGVVIDLVVAAKRLVMTALYFASLGAVGSGDWLATKEFFAGLAGLVTDPGAVLAAAWEETRLGSRTIDGPLEHGRRAEYWTRKTVYFVANVVTIVKGALTGAKKLAGLPAKARVARAFEGAEQFVKRVGDARRAEQILARAGDVRAATELLELFGGDAARLARIVAVVDGPEDAARLANLVRAAGGGRAFEARVARGAQLAGMTDEAAAKVMLVANKHGVRIKFRPSNDAGALRARGYSPKPEGLKMKTINDLDVQLGMDPAQRGMVGYFKPAAKSEAELARLRQSNPELAQRYAERLAEFHAHADQMAELQQAGLVRVKRGVVIDARPGPGKGKGIVGDYDAFSIEGAAAGQEAEVKAAVIKDLAAEPVAVQHPAHMDWVVTKEADRAMKQKIIKSHQPRAAGGGGKALAEFGPDGTVAEVFAP